MEVNKNKIKIMKYVKTSNREEQVYVRNQTK